MNTCTEICIHYNKVGFTHGGDIKVSVTNGDYLQALSDYIKANTDQNVNEVLDMTNNKWLDKASIASAKEVAGYKYIPKEITIDGEQETPPHIASFGYYDGIKYAQEKGLKQSGDFAQVFAGTHFIVCCGDVMVRVQPEDYPQIPRRDINL